MSETGILTLGLWQGAGQAGDPEKLLEQIETVCEDARDRSVDYLIFPECYLTGYFNPDPLIDVAAKVTPDRLNHLGSLSDRFGIGLQVGSYQADGNSVLNAAHVFLPEQGLIGSYGKRALYGDWEQGNFARGDGTLIFAFRGFRIGVLICVEAEFPELSRDLAARRVDLLAISTALMSPYDNVARILVPARAMENRCFVGYANFVGRQGELEFVGQSVIGNPHGDALARGDASSEELLTARLDLAEREAARQDIDYLAELPGVPR